jgi:hypothetical protein
MSTMVREDNQYKQNAKRRRGHNENADGDKLQVAIIQDLPPSL